MARPGVCVGLLVALAGNALARETIYVDASAPPGGVGTAGSPLRRITDALDAARAFRSASGEPIVIHVARGTYEGTFDPAQLARYPALEAYPLVINVRGLTLQGETVLAEDALGLPTGVVPGSETALTWKAPPDDCGPC